MRPVHPLQGGFFRGLRLLSREEAASSLERISAVASKDYPELRVS
jgi:hypothetical protein